MAIIRTHIGMIFLKHFKDTKSSSALNVESKMTSCPSMRSRRIANAHLNYMHTQAWLHAT